MYSFISCITKNIIFKSRMWDCTCSLISVMFRSAQKGRPTGWNGVNCQLTLLSGVELWAISFISAALDFPKVQWWACFFFYNKNVKFFWTKARMWVSSRSCPGSGYGPVEQQGLGGWHSPQLEVARPLLGCCLELGWSLEPHPFPPLSHWSQSSGLTKNFLVPET